MSSPRGDSTDDRLIDAAITVLGERGADGATTRLIAERADVNEVTLFRRFRTKRGLLAAVLDRLLGGFMEAAASPTGELHDDLERIAAAYVHFVDAHPAMVRLLPALTRDPDLAAIVLPAQQEVVEGLRRVVLRHQRTGELVREPSEDIIRAFMGPLLARAMLGHVLAIRQPLDIERYVQLFLAGRGRST